MSFVIDASMAAAWVLPDEHAEPTDAIMLRLEVEHAHAPPLFWHEARSLLLAAERKKRLRPGEASAFMHELWRLPIEDAGHGSDATIFALAIRYGLSTYDATYLALAVADQSSLATLDEKLAAAARAEGLLVIGPLFGENVR
jgi:predicted nucleic acid-binding protein